MSDPQRPSEDETVQQPVVGDESPEKPADTPAAAPAGPPPGWVPAQQAPPAKGGFRRFAGHRATQLVAVGLLGFVLGGGIIGTAVGVASRGGDRPGFSREHRGPDGHDGHRGFRDGPGDRDRPDRSHGG
ncbi:MAG TPA: hypothetical protein VFG15_23480 [Amycolatopsis sp.]|nr:hypothetical protein [Amycolatopsis sp.]